MAFVWVSLQWKQEQKQKLKLKGPRKQNQKREEKIATTEYVACHGIAVILAKIANRK